MAISPLASISTLAESDLSSDGPVSEQISSAPGQTPAPDESPAPEQKPDIIRKIEGGRWMVDKSNGQEFFSYRADRFTSYPGADIYYVKAESGATWTPDTVSALVRALDAGYPNDAFGLSRVADSDTDLSYASQTQYIIWGILGRLRMA